MEVSDPAISVLAEGLLQIPLNVCLSLYVPVKIYSNTDVQKLAIYIDNKNKSYFIAGFADAESCFSVFIVKNPGLNSG
jgi:hypothetical protein